MKFNLLKIFSFLLICYFLLFFLDKYFTTNIPKNTVLKHYWLLSKKEKKYDLGFIGPSRVLNTLDMSIFERDLHLTAINLGLSGAGYAEQYLMLRQFVNENKNRINKLFIEISYFNVIDPDSAFSYPFHEYYYFPYLRTKFVYDITKENTKNKLKVMAWRYIPMIRYAEYNLNFRPLILFTSTVGNGKGDQGFDKYGSLLLDKEMEDDHKTGKYVNSQMNGKTIGYLKNMIELAQENKMEVTLFTAPTYSKSFSYSKEAFSNYRKVVDELINKYRVKYHDFEFIDASSDKTNFSDRTHLNKRGAVRFTEAFCDTLANYDVYNRK